MGHVKQILGLLGYLGAFDICGYDILAILGQDLSIETSRGSYKDC
jgi:hypothetical protein